MSDASRINISIPSGDTVIAPQPRCAVNVRPATPDDLPFIDGLQKVHSYMVGWMPRKQIEGKIEAGQVLIAVGATPASPEPVGVTPASPDGRTGDAGVAPTGYVISQDTYMGRDDVGIVFQLNVVPMKQRHLIGARLIQSVFERVAYGCRLFCCWCAQDIRANYFWESIGFVPLAFRTGARGQQRTHVFWQRRVRADDRATPYWFPYETKGGSMREGRIVLPIPPGTHWRDQMPLLLPEVQNALPIEKPKTLPPTRPPESIVPYARRIAIVRSQSKHLGRLPPGKAAVVTAGGIRYVDRGDYVPEPEPVKEPKKKREPRATARNDPKHVAAARELRDRYLEEYNSGRFALASEARYDVGRRQIDADAPAALPLRIESRAA